MLMQQDIFGQSVWWFSCVKVCEQYMSENDPYLVLQPKSEDQIYITDENINTKNSF